MRAPADRLIVHVVYRFGVGGLENGVVNLINRLPRDAWRHAVVSLTDVDPTFRERVRREDVEYVALHKPPGHAVRLYPRLARFFLDRRPAIVHSRNLAALEATVPAWLARVPVRIHGEHGRDAEDPDGTSRRRQLIRRAFRPFVTHYVALSPDLRSYLQERVGVPEKKVDQIFNGVDTHAFLPSSGGRAPLEGCPFQGSEHWLVGTVGRMEAVKDQTNLARAFVSAMRLHPEARRRMRLVLVGDGDLRTRTEAILADGGVRELAWFAGERSDVAKLLQGLDCFVLPSRGEGVSNTILEAMSCALPVVATRVGANADLVHHDVSGHLVPAGQSEALAHAIVSYFADPACARRHGRAGRQIVERNFSLDRMIERYHRLYSGLTQPARPFPQELRSSMPRGHDGD